MAKVINPPAQGKPETIVKEKKKEKNSNIKYTVIGIFTAIGVILLVIGIAFTVIMKTNTAGLAEKYRANIKEIPVIRYALPKAKNPDDPKNLSREDLEKRYNALLKEKQDYLKKEQEMNSQIADLTKYKAGEDKRTSDSQSQLDQAQDLKKQADDANAKLEADKKAFDQVVANADKQGFKSYYDKMNKDIAKQVYTEIMTEQKVSDDVKKYVQIYEQMDTKSSAKILEQMGTTQTDLVVDILKNMSKDKVSKILPEMSTTFAAKISQKLSTIYMK